MVDYANMLLVAERLVEANGRTVTVTREDRTPADPAKPWEGQADPGTDSALALLAVLLEYDTDEVDGTVIERSDMRALVAAKSADDAAGAAVDLTTYDHLDDGADHWRIVGARKVKPGAVVLLYDLQLRR